MRFPRSQWFDSLVASFFWKLVVRLGGKPPAPLKRYMVMHLARGRYHNSPRVWRTRCELIAHDAATAAKAYRSTTRPNESESYVIVPWEPDQQLP